MDIIYNIILNFIALIFGYFFGSIPTGVILCKVFYNADPRKSGSKNSGGTNVGRLFGKKIGFATILLDAIKTVIPMILVLILLKNCNILEFFAKNYHLSAYNCPNLPLIFAAFGATIGHCYPIFASFKGGKAVASYAGFALATCWLNFALSLIVFLSILKKTKFVSLSSIISSVFFVLLAWIDVLLLNFLPENIILFGYWSFISKTNWVIPTIGFAVISTFISLLLILRHSANIKRLISKSESKIKWLK